MYPPGHVGITALISAPLTYLLLDVVNEREVLGWLSLAIVLTLAPDVDTMLPVIVHRGVTHTLLAAVVLGAFVAVVVWASDISSTIDRTKQTLLGFLTGAGAVVSHLLGDVITPMGIQPLFPFGGSVYTLDLVYASDPRANLSFLLVGLAALAVTYLAGGRPTPTETEIPNVDAEESATPPN